jgi:hypothetical protein
MIINISTSPSFATHRFSAKPYLQRVWADFGNEVGFGDFPFNITP